jgi:hypothetical protein
MKWFALLTVLMAPALLAQDLPDGPIINEGSDTIVTFRLKSGNVADDVRWFVDDEDTDTRLYGPILPTPLANLNLPLPPQAHRIVNDAKGIEVHVLTAIARDNGKYMTKRLRFPVRNLNVVVSTGAGGTPNPQPTPTPGP